MSTSVQYVPRSMRRQIRIERFARTRNAQTGEWIDASWTLLRTGAAHMSIKTGAETNATGKIISTQVTEWVIRYIDGLTTKDRLVYEAINHEILSIVELGTRHYHKITTQVTK